MSDLAAALADIVHSRCRWSLARLSAAGTALLGSGFGWDSSLSDGSTERPTPEDGSWKR